MSKIRDRILRGEGAHGTVAELGDWLVESIRQLKPQQKVEIRKQIRIAHLRSRRCSTTVH
jgi:hypothetical protein